MERINTGDFLDFMCNNNEYVKPPFILSVLRSAGNIIVRDDNQVIFASKYPYMMDKLQEGAISLTRLSNKFLNITDAQVLFSLNYNEMMELYETPEEKKIREDKLELERIKQLEQQETEEKERQERLKQNIQTAYDTFRKYTMIDATKYEIDAMFKNDGNAKAIAAVKEWIKEPERNRIQTHHFLTLVGECGRGKTHIALCIANEYLKKPNNIDWWSTSVNSVDYFQVANLLTQLKAGFNDNSNDDIMQRCNRTNLLVLDDLGMQRDTDWALEQLDMIIDNRYIKKQDTIFTTNMKLSELPKRIASRLAEGDSYVIGGEDFRAIKAKERKRK